jgi:hypothetical protein
LLLSEFQQKATKETKNALTVEIDPLLPNNPHQKTTEDYQCDNQATTTDALTAAMGLFFHR